MLELEVGRHGPDEAHERERAGPGEAVFALFAALAPLSLQTQDEAEARGDPEAGGELQNRDLHRLHGGTQ